jgi:hypothetical protein
MYTYQERVVKLSTEAGEVHKTLLWVLLSAFLSAQGSGVQAQTSDVDPEADVSAAQAAVRRAQQDANISNSGTAVTSAGADARATAEGDASSAPKLVAARIKDYLREDSAVWEALKAGNEVSERLDKVLGSLDAANDAYASDQMPASDPTLQRAITHADSENAQLSVLAQKSASSWLYDSGANTLQPFTYPPAEAYLDRWSQSLSKLKSLLESLLPLAKMTETTYDAKGVVDIGRGDTSMVFSNGIALSDSLFPKLGNSSTQIDTTLGNLRLARSVLFMGPSPAAQGQRTCGPGTYLLPNGLCTDAINDRLNRTSSYPPPLAQQPAVQPQTSPCAPGDHSSCGCTPPGATSCR